MTLVLPKGQASQGEVRLFAFGQEEPVDRARTETGAIDLLELFPKTLASDLRVLFAQAYVIRPPSFEQGESAGAGEARPEAVGPSVVLQPMLTPAYAPRSDREGVPMFAEPAKTQRVRSGLIAYVDKHVVFETMSPAGVRGTMVFALRPDAAPNTVRHFRELVEGGLYTDIRVHRAASLGAQPEPDLIQFGDPSIVRTNTAKDPGTGGPGFMIDLEPHTLNHDFGVMSFARGDDPNSAGSQVVITLNRERGALLDGKHAAFAQLIDGADTLARLGATPVDVNSRTLDAPTIVSARLIDAPPFPKRPAPVVDPARRPTPR